MVDEGDICTMSRVNDVIVQPRFSADDLQRSAADFLRRLKDAPEPLVLVRRLGPHDLLLTLRAADDEQRCELLSLADRGQVSALVDLACWKKNRFRPEALEALIRPLADSGADGASKLVDDLDPEARVLLLRRYAVVHLRERPEDEVPAAEGSELIETPDGYYFIELPDPGSVPTTVRNLFRALLLRSFEEYQPELEALRHELPSETEQSALRWRNGRLADLGFGTREESRSLLAPRDPRQVSRLVRDDAPAIPPLDCDIPLPAIHRAALEGRPFLDAALAAMAASRHPLVADRAGSIWSELGAMTNLYLTAVDCDLADPFEVARHLRWARDLLSLGVEIAAGGDPERAAVGLARQAPGLFVQTAMGRLAPLRERARAVLEREGRIGSRRELLDRPHAVALEALAREVPGRWPPLDEGQDTALLPAEPLPGELSAFASRSEVRRAEMLIEEAELVDEMLERLGATRPAQGDRAASALVSTALCNAALGREARFAPLSAADWRAGARRALAPCEEELVMGALGLLGPSCGCDPEGTSDPVSEDDPRRRLLLRTILLAAARLAARHG